MDTIFRGAATDTAFTTSCRHKTQATDSSEQAIFFLKRFHPGTPWSVVTIAPDGRMGPSQTFDPQQDEERARRFIGEHNGTRNLYFSAACLSRRLAKKASKTDIAEIHWLHADIDLDSSLDWSDPAAVQAERDRVFASLHSYNPAPTVIGWSGGGFQAFWRLSEIIYVNGDPSLMAPAERRMELIASALGGDNCHNADRIMRLPGTINVLSKTKIAAGRKPTLAEIVEFHDDRIYDLEEFPEVEPQSTCNGFDGTTHHTRSGQEEDRIRDALVYIPADDYNTYFEVCAAIKSKLGDAGFGVARDWAVRSVKFDDDEFRRKWASLKPEGGIAIGTLYKAAKDRGWRDDRPSDRRERRSDRGGFSSFSGFSRHSASENLPGDDPLPLTRPLPPADPFPVEALGPSMAAAALAFQAQTQAPMGICANSVLASAALAAQAHADVMLPTGESKPINEYFVTIAESGERKTAVDSRAMVPIREHQQKLRVTYEIEITKYTNDHDAWESERQKTRQHKKLGYEAKKRALEELGPEPLKPLGWILTSDEPTIEGLIKAWPLGQPSIGVFSSEGGAFIGGHGLSPENKLRMAAMLSKLWDNGTVTRVRAGDCPTAMTGLRLSLHLQCQPGVASLLFTDRLLADQGILSRILISAPDPLKGTREWREADSGHNSAVAEFCDRINALFNRPLQIRDGTRNELAPHVLEFSPAARQMWIEFYNETEAKLVVGGAYRPSSGLAAKLPEHAARLAGIMALYENPDAPSIDGATLARAILLAEYYMNTALRIHGAGQVTAALNEAEALLDWLQKRWEPEHGADFSLPDVVQYGPNSIRVVATARRLISILEEHRYVVRHPEPVMLNGKMRQEAWRLKYRAFQAGR